MVKRKNILKISDLLVHLSITIFVFLGIVALGDYFEFLELGNLNLFVIFSFALLSITTIFNLILNNFYKQKLSKIFYKASFKKNSKTEEKKNLFFIKEYISKLIISLIFVLGTIYLFSFLGLGVVFKLKYIFLVNLVFILLYLILHLWQYNFDFNKAFGKIYLYSLATKNPIKGIFIFFLLYIFILEFNFKFYGLPSHLFNILSISNIFKVIIFIITFLIGIFLIIKNKNIIAQRINLDYQKEKIKEKKRIKRIEKSKLFIFKIPFLSWVFKEVYKNGILHLFFLILIIGVFTAIKLPYMQNPLLGAHTAKYTSYVEPAIFMIENNTPFWNQEINGVDPINNPKGIKKGFLSWPFMEWSIYKTFKIFPKNSIGTNVRIVMHVLGVVILVLAYKFFNKFFIRIQSLLITLLISFNPMFIFSTYLTVQDPWAIMFMFLSFIFLAKYFQRKKFSYLYLSSIFVGLGLVSKYSLMLWLLPIVFFLILFRKKDWSECIYISIIYFGLALLQIFVAQTVNSNLITSTSLALSILTIWILFHILLFNFITKVEQKFKNLIKNILQNKYLILLFSIFIIVILIFFIRKTRLFTFTSNFLTDKHLILNYKMYRYTFLKQFKNYITEAIFYFGLLGIIYTLILNRTRKIFAVTIGFLSGSLLYWILASKPMFFHNYYTLIIMILFSLGTANLIYIVQNLINKNNEKHYYLLIVAIFILLIFPTMKEAAKNNLYYSKDRTANFLQVISFIKQNTKENEFVLTENCPATISTYSKRGVPSVVFLQSQQLEKLVKKSGLKNTMDHYNIKFLVIRGDNPNYYRYIHLFSNENFEKADYNRTNLINSTIEEGRSFVGNANNYLNIDNINSELTDLNLKDKFILEEKIGSYKIYSFNN